jgi:uncharacterized protein DUF4232
MDDLEERLREALTRRAVTVPRGSRVPAGLIHRAGLRIARNATVGLVAAAVVGVGMVSGVHALTSSRPRPAATPRVAPACRANQLTGTSKLESSGKKAQAREGVLVVENKGSIPCSLEGRPAVRVRDGVGTSPPMNSAQIDPYWKVRGIGAPPEWPVVTLQPGDRAEIHVRWTNSCAGPDNPPVTWEIELSSGNGVVPAELDQGQDIPNCANPNELPTLKSGPFEPFVPLT